MLRLIALASGSFLLLATSAPAAKIVVKKGGAIATIQAGVAAAKPGDTVLVKKGVYQEAVVVPAGLTGLTLKASGAVTIEARQPGGAGAGAGITVESAGVSIIGFRIQNAASGIGTSAGAAVVGSAADLRLEKLDLRGCAADAVSIVGDRARVIGCTISSPPYWYGMDIRGDDVLVTDTTVTSACSTGIYVNGARARVSKCTVRGTEDGYGIHVTGVEGLIEKNVLECVNYSGILVYGDQVTVRKNKVRGAAEYGVEIQGSGAVVRENLLLATAGGVLVTGDGASVSKNDIRDCHGIGIDVVGSLAAIEKNDLERMDGSCIRVTGDGPTVVGNDGSDATDGGHGVELIGPIGYGTIADNEFQRVAGAGVYVDWNCTGITITGNQVLDSSFAEYGAFYLNGGSHVVTGNVAKRSGGDGFYIVGDNLVLKNNDSLDNQRDGFDVDSGSGSWLEKNVAKGNGAEGIENNRSGTTVLNNTAKGNRIDFANSGAGAVFTGNTSGDGSHLNPPPPEID